MNKKLINSIIMLLASGVCFFFTITGINVGVGYIQEYSEISSTVNELKDKANKATGDYMKEYYEKQIKNLEEEVSEESGIFLRNAFTGFFLSIAGVVGIVFAFRYFIGKNHYSIFSWVAAGVTSAAAIAYLVGAITALSDKKVATFNMLPVKESPLGVIFILCGVLYILILGAQFLTIILAKNGEDAPLTFGAPTPAPAAPTAAPATPVAPIATTPVAPAPAAPVAPAPEAPVENPGITPGMPTAA